MIALCEIIVMTGFGRGRQGGGTRSGNKVPNHLTFALDLVCLNLCPRPNLPDVPNDYHMILGWPSVSSLYRKILRLAFDILKTPLLCSLRFI